ncbi:MAG: TM0106 family RecB-like putative nuclease [Candidatus Thorarchaeota archaeon]
MKTMFISHYDIRVFYKCPMLLYLNKHGPQEEKEIHPIIKKRHKTSIPSISPEFVKTELKKTLNLIKKGVDNINQKWMFYNQLSTKIDKLKKIDENSVFGSYAYEPVFTRGNIPLRKPLVMEGVFTAYICSQFQNIDLNYFILQREKEREKFTFSEEIDTLLSDLPRIKKILEDDIDISPNYTRGCRVCEWRIYCRNLAKETSDLTLISGIGKRIKKELKAIGINNVKDLAEVDIAKISNEIAHKKELTYFKLQAKAIVEKKVIVRQKVVFPKNKIELFVDIEGSSHHDFIWIIGCFIRIEDKVEYRSFLANSPKEEKEMIVSFFKFLSEFEDDFIIYHWSSAEPQYFKQLTEKYNLQVTNLSKILKNSFDLFPIFKENIILPLYSYTLKEVANWLGFQWHDPLSDGATSIVLFDKWYIEKNKKALQKAISYNSDDCRALIITKDYLIKNLSDY